MPWRTAIDNVLLGLDILGADRAGSQAIAREWLAKLGLSGHENDYPHALSGGMRQRVSIARALAVDPMLILCDEPFSALDEMTAQRLRAEFLRLVREAGKTALFITHSIDEALEVGDRIMVLHRPRASPSRPTRAGRSRLSGVLSCAVAFSKRWPARASL